MDVYSVRVRLLWPTTQNSLNSAFLEAIEVYLGCPLINFYMMIDDNDSRILHGIKVCKFLVVPWFYTNRVMCGDSYLHMLLALFILIELS